MRRKRTKHVNYVPAVCIGVSALLFLCSLGLLLHQCSAPKAPAVEPRGNITQLDDGGELTLQLQEPQLPNGCEVTSLAMLLGWAGYPVDKVSLYQGYLPRQNFIYDQDGSAIGGDPEQVYVGDAASQTGGWYCMEGPIVEAGNAYLQDQGSREQVEAVSGLSHRELDEFLRRDIPLVVWVTLDYDTPMDSIHNWYLSDGTFYQPYANLHCVVVLARGDQGYLTADPLEGWQWVDESLFWASFDAMGRRAVTIENEE